MSKTILLKFEIRIHVDGDTDVQVVMDDEFQVPIKKKRGRPRKPFIFSAEAMLSDEKWALVITDEYKIDVFTLSQNLSDFVNYCISIGKEHDKPHSAKRHFVNWLKWKGKNGSISDKSDNEIPSGLFEIQNDDDLRVNQYLESYQL